MTPAVTRVAERSRVLPTFDAAADYDTHAVVQRRIARSLAERIAAQPIVAARGDRLRLLEIGCGTGFLTRELQDRGVGGQWLVTDLAPAMVDRCIEATNGRIGKAKLEFAAMDGEHPTITQGFDIICSSMAFQWFDDLDAALTRLAALLSPGGILCFSTLLSGTFDEWEQAHGHHGLRTGGLTYPDLESLARLFPANGSLTLAELVLRQQHADGLEFLRSLKAIGAGATKPGRRPLPPQAFRRVVAAFEAGGAAVTYRTALCCWTANSF